MLEERDLSILKEVMEGVIEDKVPKIITDEVPKIIADEVPKIIAEEVPKIIAEQVPRIVDERVSEAEDFLLDEIGRTQTYLERKIDRIAKDVEELKGSYRINRLEHETVILLQKNVTELDRRVSVLEGQMA